MRRRKKKHPKKLFSSVQLGVRHTSMNAHSKLRMCYRGHVSLAMEKRERTSEAPNLTVWCCHCVLNCATVRRFAAFWWYLTYVLLWKRKPRRAAREECNEFFDFRSRVPQQFGWRINAMRESFFEKVLWPIMNFSHLKSIPCTQFELSAE